MKIPLLAILAFLPCLALAQSTTNTNQPSCNGPKQWEHHQQSPEKQLARLTTKLGLSQTQQGQIGSILVSRDEQLKTIFQNTSLTKEQKLDQVKTLMENTNQQIETYLTSEQDAQFQALQRHHHDKPEQQ